MPVSLLAIIAYSLVLIFFIVLTALLLLFTRPAQQAVASTTLPSLRKEPAPYVFLAVLFVLFIILTVFSRKERG